MRKNGNENGREKKQRRIIQGSPESTSHIDPFLST
jgi:hypothetical protein